MNNVKCNSCGQSMFEIGDDLFGFGPNFTRVSVEAVVEMANNKRKREDVECDCGSTIKFHSPRCSATQMNVEKISIYNQALTDLIVQLREVK